MQLGIPAITAVGEMRDEDMVVLLSERAAKEIYRKWLDTLHVSFGRFIVFVEVDDVK